MATIQTAPILESTAPSSQVVATKSTPQKVSLEFIASSAVAFDANVFPPTVHSAAIVAESTLPEAVITTNLTGGATPINVPVETAVSTPQAFDTNTYVQQQTVQAEIATSTPVAFDIVATEQAATNVPVELATSPPTAFDVVATEQAATNVPVELAASTPVAYDVVVSAPINVALETAVSTSIAYDVTVTQQISVPMEMALSNPVAYDIVVTAQQLVSMETAVSTSSAYDVTVLGSQTVPMEYVGGVSVSYDLQVKFNSLDPSNPLFLVPIDIQKDDTLFMQFDGVDAVLEIDSPVLDEELFVGAPISVRAPFLVNYGSGARLTRFSLPYVQLTKVISTRDLTYDIKNTNPIEQTFETTYSGALYSRLTADYGESQKVSLTMETSYAESEKIYSVMVAGYDASAKVASSMEVPYSESTKLTSRMESDYGAATLVSKAFEVPYQLTDKIKSQMELPYLQAVKVTSGMVSPYQSCESVSDRLTVPYNALTNVTGRFESIYDLTNLNSVSQRLISYYSDEAVGSYEVAQDIVVRLNGVVLDVNVDSSSTINFSEGSHSYSATIEVVDRSDYLNISVGDEVEIDFGVEVFNLLVMEKTSERAVDSAGYYITCMSKLASIRDNMVDGSYAGVSALAAVQSILPGYNIAWEIEDWVLPKDAVFYDSTVTQTIQTIVEAVGGLCESLPNGDVLVRYEFPVAVNKASFDTKDLTLSEHSDIVTSKEKFSLTKVKNFYEVTNESEEDSLGADYDYNVVDTAPFTKTVEVFGVETPKLLTTGSDEVVIYEPTQELREITEVIEIKQGVGTIAHKAESVLSYVWKYSSLGTITVDGVDVTADSDGYSLLEITYTTLTTNWVVENRTNEVTQFLITE